MRQLFGPRRPFPAPLEPSPQPLDPASMPRPPLAAVKKMRLRLPYARNRVERAWGMAMIGLHILTCGVTLWIWLFDSVPEDARFLIWLYLCLAAAMVVITCVDICYDDPSPQQAAAVQLPPPPPEMDMC